MNNELKKAIQILDQGGVVGIPTETVYGLAAKVDHPEAIKKIFTIKDRPFFDPLIVHVSKVEQIKKLVDHWPRVADILSAHFWPGPLTLVLQKSKEVSDLITAGLPTVGIRLPKHPLALELLNSVGPLAAPSANKFGKTSPTTADHVKSEFKNEEVFVLDGGPCSVGIESTILMVNTNLPNKVKLSVLRQGMITKSEIETVLKKNKIDYDFFIEDKKIQAPGQMKHHYMPDKPFVVVTSEFLLDLLKNEKTLGADEIDYKNFETRLAATEDKNSFLKQLLQSKPNLNKNLKDLILLKMKSLPEVVENIRLTKVDAIKNFSYLALSEEAALAARELYSALRVCAQEECEVILFFEAARAPSEKWLPIWDRIKKAATLIL